MLKFSTLRTVSTPGIVDGVRLQDMNPGILMIFNNFGWVITDGVGESKNLIDYALIGKHLRLSSMDVIIFQDAQQMQSFFDHSFDSQLERAFQNLMLAARNVPRQLSVLTLDEFYAEVGDLNLDQFRHSPHLLMSKLGHSVIERREALRFSQLNLRASVFSYRNDTPESWFWEQQGLASLHKARTEKHMQTDGSELELGVVSYRAAKLSEPARRFVEFEKHFLFLPHPWLSEYPHVVLCENRDYQAVFEGAYWSSEKPAVMSGWLAHIPPDFLSVPTRSYWPKYLRTVNIDRPPVNRTMPMDLTFAVRG